jgi:CHAD domain-containing protein
MSPVRRYRLAADAEVEGFVAGLGQRTALEDEHVEVVERTVHDTFDWRLHAAGSTIERQRVLDEPTATVVWRSLDRGDVLARLDREDVPRFAWDLDPGPTADRLATILEMRALLPLASLTTRRTTLRLLDDERKTVARLVAEAVVDPERDGLDPVISVVPLRGYDREARRLTDLLDAQVLLTPGADDIVVAALRAAGYAPGSYSSKLRTNLDPTSRAADAWVEVLRLLLAAMRTNEAGLRGDLDSEFLHDFRVAVRRARSILGEAKGILEAEPLAHVASELKWLGRATGPTRDLDVFLLDTAAYADSLPRERRDDLKAFTAYLEERQREAHRALVADLDRDRYRQLVGSWSQLLEPPATADAPDRDRPAPEVAAERIAAAHRRLIKRGRRIDRSSDPERLHDLRKDAKRLRYLLECFGSLFPSDEIAPIVKQLKGVQDVLGTFQDGQVQSAQLESFAQELLDRGDVGASGVMAIGLLVEQLEQRSHDARAAFADRFASFDQKTVRSAVRLLHDPAGVTGADAVPNLPEEPSS